MKVYIVRDSRTHEKIGSRKKTFFTSIAHIKTAELWNYVKRGQAYIEVFDLNLIEPEIINRESIRNYIIGDR